MNTYFSTYITGLGDVVIPALKKRLSKFKVKLLLDGLVIYDTKSSDKEIEYTKMLERFVRVLKPHGLIVILAGQKELLEKLFEKFSNLKLLNKYSVLVSGKKAGIYKLVLLTNSIS